MRGGARCQNRSRIAVFDDFRDGLRNSFNIRLNEQAGLVGQNGIGNSAHGRRDAGEAACSSFEIDQTKAFHASRRFRDAGQTEEIAGSVNIADLFIRQ